MKQALFDLLSSKKFIVGAATAIVALVAHVGYGADKDTVAMILGFGSTMVLGQGIADHGKEAAKINAGDKSGGA